MPESQSHTTVQEDVATPLLEPEEVEGLESEEDAPAPPPTSRPRVRKRRAEAESSPPRPSAPPPADLPGDGESTIIACIAAAARAHRPTSGFFAYSSLHLFPED